MRGPRTCPGQASTVRRHGTSCAPGPDPRRGPQLQAGHPRPAFFRASANRRTARSTTPGPPSTCCTAARTARRPRRHSLDELRTFTGQVTPQQRRKRHLADGLPARPGRLPLPRRARPGALRRHVPRPAHPGPQLLHGLREAQPHGRDGRHRRAVDAVLCAHRARGRGPRAAADRRSTSRATTAGPSFPERSVWVKLTVEPFPRLSIVREVTADTALPRPVRIERAAELAVAALHEAVPLRQCRSACIRDGGSPRASWPRWAAAARPATAAKASRSTPSTSRPCASDDQRRSRSSSTLLGRIGAGRRRRFEEAAAKRDRLATFVRAAARGQRLAALAARAQLVAARPTADGGWELSWSRHGRLAGGGHLPPGAAPCPTSTRWSRRRDRGPGGRADAGRERRGDRVRPALARGARRPAGRARRILGCPAYGAGGQRVLLDLATTVEPEVDPVRRSARPASGAAGPRGLGFAEVAAERRVITAIVLVQAAVDRIPEVAEAIAELTASARSTRSPARSIWWPSSGCASTRSSPT